MGTLNKFAGKIKNFFGIGSKAVTNSEKSFQRTMENAQAEAIEKRNEDKAKPHKTVKNVKRSFRHRQSHKPPWWVRFYGKRTRAEVGPLKLHMVGYFGNFRAIKKICYPGTTTPISKGGFK